jgi:hypothetical protein
MKVLTIPNRLKWMKACAALWGRTKQNFSQIRFARDDVQEGEHLNDLLESIPPEVIEGFLERSEWKLEPGKNYPDGHLDLRGLAFYFHRETSTLVVRKMAQSG